MKLNEVMDATENEKKSFYHTLKLECGQNIARQEVPFFRGFQHDIKEFGSHKINGWREPRDSSELGTHIFNKIIENQTGIKDIRNTAYFVTHDSHLAHYHGEVGAQTGAIGLVFPVDGSKFISTNFRDGLSFCNIIDRKAMMFFNSPHVNLDTDWFTMNYGKNKQLMEFIDEMISQENVNRDEHLYVNGVSTNPHAFDTEDHEIMVWHSLPTEYYYWDLSFETAQGRHARFEFIKEKVTGIYAKEIS